MRYLDQRIDGTCSFIELLCTLHSLCLFNKSVYKADGPLDYISIIIYPTLAVFKLGFNLGLKL